MPRADCDACRDIAPKRSSTRVLENVPCRNGHRKPTFGCESCIEQAAVQRGGDVVIDKATGRWRWRK